MELSLRFTEGDWERIGQDWSAWWQGELVRPLMVLECIERLDGYDPHCAAVFLGNYPLDMPVDLILDEFIPRLENTHFLGDSFPRFWPNFGPGIAAAFAGAQVHPAWDTTWFTPAQYHSASAQQVTPDWSNPWWLRVVEFTRRAVERWGEELSIGITDLGGNLDILASLRDTRQLLMDLVVAPDEISRLVGDINACGWSASTVFARSSLLPGGGSPAGVRCGHRIGATCCRVISPT